MRRFFLISAAVGLLIGICEAYVLWTKPRTMPLPQPDVGYGIWFLAPLVDMAFLGLLGLAAGWLARRATGKEVFVAAVEAGVAFTFVTLMLTWFHFPIGLRPFEFKLEVVAPVVRFLVGFILFLPLFAVMRHRLGKLSGPWGDRWLKRLAWGLGAVTIAAAAGLAVFVARPFFPGTVVQAAAPAPSAPNIIFITLDTVRADHLSSYGYSRPTTPNLDRFARRGVLFENAIAPTSWTLASHASIFTGLLPQQHGADWAVPLDSSPWTMAEILRSHGYQTAGFTGNLLYMEAGWGVAQGFESYFDARTLLRHNLTQTFFGNAVVQPLYQNFWKYDWLGRRDAGQLNQCIFDWFRGHARHPYFVFINYFDVHDPYVTSAPFDSRFGKISMDLNRRFHEGVNGAPGLLAFTPRERASLVNGYDDCLAYLDNQVGKLLEFLRRLPGWKNTIVIITSDHGEEFGLHDSYEHGRNLYRGVLHVPLIIAGPGVPRDVRVRHLAATRQIFSTVLDLAGGGTTPFSRLSLARYWNPNSKPTPFDDAVVSELDPLDDLNGARAMISVTTPQWQYIEHHDGRQELYDWNADPQEQHNLAATMQDRATLERLHSRLVDLASSATGPWRGSAYLQALGNTSGTSRLNLLFPRPYQSGATNSQFRIGAAQAYFKAQPPSPTQPSRSERELMQSLPYQ